jgi:tRNA G18 (ribose-2'-O)-methylase SpoU
MSDGTYLLDLPVAAGRRGTAAAGRGYFAVGIYHPKTGHNVGGLWRSAGLYGAAMVFTVGRRYRAEASDTMRVPSHVPLLHFADVDDLVEHLPHGCRLAGVELDPRAVELGRYVHPERVAYLLGAEDHGLPEAVRARCHELVQIETPAPWSMNVASAGTVLAYDRFMKARRPR